MKKIETVFWDFNGVWSKDVFYKSFVRENPRVWNFIQTNVFGANGRDRVKKWMRGELTMNDINRFISQGTGMEFGELTERFLRDVGQMEVETRHPPLVQKLKRRGIKVAMVTDNMEVLDTITRPRLKLDELFDGVFNSFAHKRLKAEGLFDLAVQEMGAEYATTLMIDDSTKARADFEARGGNTYAYTNFEEFQWWVEDNLV